MSRRPPPRRVAALLGIIPLVFAPPLLGQEIDPEEESPPDSLILDDEESFAEPDSDLPAEEELAGEEAEPEEASSPEVEEAPVEPEPANWSEPEEAVGAEAVSLGEPMLNPVSEPPPSPPRSTFNDKLVFDTGRTPIKAGSPGEMQAQIHGEYQLRFSHRSDLPLTPTIGNPSSTLGQRNSLYHWLRVTPRFQVGKSFEIVGQFDFPRGMIAGDLTQAVDQAEEPLDDRSWLQFAPRWLYLEKRASYGLWRIGQQGSHWGMGLVANDGNHPPLFGDYRGGDIVERILFATRPFGQASPFVLGLAGDLVFQDEQAKLWDGDKAWQGVVSLSYDDKENISFGVYGVYRHQRREQEGALRTPFNEKLEVFVIDVAGKVSTDIPGANAYAFLEFEAATIFGETNIVRSVDQAKFGEYEKIRSYGGAARIGAVKARGKGDARYGEFVASLEWGYASGDANPNDGTTKRFTFDPNHKVGLVLFDQVFAWKTARAATAASDPELLARPMPGTHLLPSNGGVFGATYLYPTFIYRPRANLDTKLGIVIAQSTADIVDPYRLNAHGLARNWDGGDSSRHDLGIELDLGFEWRLPLGYGLTTQLGAEGGVLFPGHAFDNEKGERMPNQWLLMGRAGLQF